MREEVDEERLVEGQSKQKAGKAATSKDLC